MTRLPLSTNGRSTRRVAGVHRTSEGVRIVVVETGDNPRVVDASTVAEDRLADALRERRLDEVVNVAPASRVICRLVEAPLAGNQEQDAAAIALLAETQLPEFVPAHRKAAGVLVGEGGPSAHILLTAWPERDDDVDTPNDQHWISEPAALAMLTDSGLSWRLDREQGSICVVARGDESSSVRAMLGDASTDRAWAHAARTPIEEAAQAAGLDVSLNGSLSGLSLPDDAFSVLSSRIGGMTSGEGWMDRYAIALGAALCAASQPTTASLASMRRIEPHEREAVHKRISTWLSTPSHAYLTLAACALFALLAPLGLAMLQLTILDAKADLLSQRETELRQLRERAAMYRQLEASRWPMTKLLADIAGATPVGVVADSIRLNTRQGLRIEGTADSDDQIVTFQQLLADARIFYNVQIDSTDSSDPNAVGFAISADVRTPLTDVVPVQDFAESTLAQRLYGEDATNTEFKASSGASRSPRRATPSRDSLNREREDAPERAGARPTAEDVPVPPPLTDEQISAMSRMEAMTEFVKRRTYSQQTAGLDPATKDRLENDVRRLQAHSRGGGG